MPKRKDGAYVINLDDKQSKETHWVLLINNTNTAVYFDSFAIEYIPQVVLNKIKDKSITDNILKIQDDFIMCEFFCIAFIEYMFCFLQMTIKGILTKSYISILRTNISSLEIRLKNR